MSADSPHTDPIAYRRGRAGGGGYAAFGLLCAAIGAGLALGGAHLVQGLKPRPPALEAAAPAAPPAAVVTPPNLAAPAPPPPAADSLELDRLDARLAALESRQGQASQAAAHALAAAALVEATQQSGPFARELAAVRAQAPTAPELAALARVAETGAPTKAALAESFPDYAARAAGAALAPADGAGLGDRLVYVLSRIVTIRRVTEAPGNATDAVLARAERLVEDGDLDRALTTLDALPPAAREAMAPWRMRAERRAEIDRAAAALRARALAELAAAGRSGG